MYNSFLYFDFDGFASNFNRLSAISGCVYFLTCCGYHCLFFSSHIFALPNISPTWHFFIKSFP